MRPMTITARFLSFSPLSKYNIQILNLYLCLIIDGNRAVNSSSLEASVPYIMGITPQRLISPPFRRYACYSIVMHAFVLSHTGLVVSSHSNEACTPCLMHVFLILFSCHKYHRHWQWKRDQNGL